MSRTDIHRPIWVLARDPFVRHWFTDHHDHSRGSCDLDVFLNTRVNFPRTRCARYVNEVCPNLCGCNMCTGRIGRKIATRASRRAARLETRNLRGVANAGEREDFDIRDLRRRADYWW